MVAEQRPYHVLVLSSLLLYSSTLLSAQNQFYNSTANLSTSWINHPSLIANNSHSNTLTPILFRGSKASSFICGFYCNISEKYGSGLQDSKDCIFGVLIFQDVYGLRDQFTVLPPPQLVWSVNRNNPVQTGAALQLRQDGDLVLAKSDGTLVWSSNTAGKSVAGMNLTEEGNLVLFGRNRKPIWQSFDYPTDSLLPGQMLTPGQRLTASVSASNWSEGLLYLSFDHAGLKGYIKSNPPQRYYFLEFNDPIFDNYYFSATSASPQFMRFGPDGHLKVYRWGGFDWIEIEDRLTSDIRAKDCGYPMVCGNYGVCSNGQCSCIETINGQGSFFKQIHFGQPNLGCSLVTPISCSHSEDHSLLELQNTFYFAFNSSEEKTLLEDCKNSCLRNCSCKAAVFAKASSGSSSRNGSCLLLNEIFSMANNENLIASSYNTTLFVKVQNSHAKGSRRKTVILASTLAAVFVVLCVIGSCLVLFRKRNDQSSETEADFLNHLPGLPTRYSYENLKATTEDFSKKLGEGGFGSVYEGALSDGTKIAVKCLDSLAKVKDSFLVEVKTIGKDDWQK